MVKNYLCSLQPTTSQQPRSRNPSPKNNASETGSSSPNHSLRPSYLPPLPSEVQPLTISSETLAIFLIRMNEDPGLAPLLAAFFENVVVEVTEVIRGLSAQARNKKLVGLIGRLLARWAKTNRTVYVFDDMQWIDSISLEILSQVFRAKPEDLNLTAFKSMASSSQIVHLPLAGLRKEDIGDYLNSFFACTGVKTVDPEIISAFYEKTAASPLALEMAVGLLRKRNSLRSNNGKLQFEDGNLPGDILNVLDNNIGQSVMIQFARLSSAFQNFLQKACILGQYFALDDVRQILDTPTTNDALRLLIATEDHFSFLKPDEILLTPPARSNRQHRHYFFRHITIAGAVYDSLGAAVTMRLHERVGRMLEAKISIGNRDRLLPLLCHHFAMGGVPEKRILYAEELGLHYDKKGYKKEAILILSDLIQYVEGLHPSELPPPFNQKDRQACWYANLASAATADYQSAIIRPAAKRTLDLIGLDFPHIDSNFHGVRKPRSLKSGILIRCLRQFWLFNLTKGGRRSFGHIGAPRVDGRKGLSLQGYLYADQALSAVAWLAIADDSMANDYKAIVLLELLNLNIMVSSVRPSLWAMRALSLAYLLALKAPGLCRIYYRAAKHAAERCKPQELTLAFWYYSSVLVAIFGEDEKEVEEFSNTYQSYGRYAILIDLFFVFTSQFDAKKIRIFEERGDVANWQSAKNVLFYLHYPKNFDDAESLLMSKHEEGVETELLTAHATVCLMLKCSIIAKRIEKLNYCLQKLLGYRQRVIDVVKMFPNYGNTPIATAYLWLAVLKKDTKEAAEQITNLANYANTLDILTQHIHMARLGFLSLWLLFTHIDSDTDKVSFISTREAFLSASEKVLPMFKNLHRCVPADAVYFKIFLASLHVLKGAKKKAVSLLGEVLDKKVVDRWQGVEPIWFGVARVGLVLLGGYGGGSKGRVGDAYEGTRHRKDVEGWFGGVDADTFVDWAETAGPLRNMWWGFR
ncbi:hypothetical protein HDU67_006627 [Dinochytrium kinnereticum]|nr:hypothetical protein HDU67_006627 [Dinochytrium kinnereticum]